MTLEQKVGLLFKWIIATAIFLAIIMPVQLIWFLLLPFLRWWAKKQIEKTNVYIDIQTMGPFEWYGNIAKRFLSPNF